MGAMTFLRSLFIHKFTSSSTVLRGAGAETCIS
jgi:hypothetical protein